MSGPLRRLALIGGLLWGVLILGTAGYRLIEGRPLFDSFYMALISLTTVGYTEVWDLTLAERVFTSVLLMVGVTVVFAAIGIMSDLVLQLELENFFGRKRTQRMLKKLDNHYIVCGAGRVGRGVIRELQRGRAQVVLIDSSADRAAWAEELGVPTLIADATLDKTLLEAGIDKAKGLVAAIGSDAENVYVTLTARGLNPKLLIAARASDEQAEDKLRRAGAATVFTPYTFIGHRLGQAMLRPHVLSFLDVASAFKGADLDLDLEQVRVSERSSVAEKTLEQSQLRQRFGVIVLAIMRHDGQMTFNPAGQTKIHPSDVLIMMGERAKLNKIEAELEV
ncbi:MAG: potassium channel protein [Acidobacteria bacterium]|nr:potassium channel protein [Acidobacteriota bacterium]